MSSLIDLIIDRPVAVVMGLISLVLLGVLAVFRLPMAFMPFVEPPNVNVSVPFPGSHPLEGLREVAEPLEAEIATVTGLKELSSESQAGSVSLNAQFDWAVNLDIKEMEIREAVERVRPALPDDVGRITVQTFSAGPGDGAILQGRISAKRDLSESWALLDQTIRRPLERIKGVARVELGGVEPHEVQVALDLPAMERHGVAPRDIAQRIQGANLDMDSGSIVDGRMRFDVRVLGRFETLEQLQNLPIPVAGGQSYLPLSELAEVGLKERLVDYGRHLDREFAISIDVFKEPTANTVETVDRILEEVKVIEANPELKGVKLLVWNNSGEEIRRAIGSLRDAGIFGGFLAAFVLLLFLRRVTTTLIVSVAIPFSLLVTCGALYLLGGELNVLTMLGLMLGVGMLVDNAVVVVENIYRLQAKGMSPKDAARNGTKQVMMAVIASTATSVIVWTWLFGVQPGYMTVYLGAVALVICLTVICSLLISLTFIPLAASRLPAPPLPEANAEGLIEETGFVAKQLVPRYRRLLHFTLRHRWSTLIILLSLAGSAAYPIMNVEVKGEPTEREDYVTLRYQIHDSLDLAAIEGYVNEVEAWLWPKKEALEFESLYSYYNANGWAMTRVYVPDSMANERALTALKDKLREDLPNLPGISLSLSEQRWWRRGGQSRWVRVDLHGEDPEYLRELASEVEGKVQGWTNTKEVFGPSVRGRKEARILVDAEGARSKGLSPQAIAETVAFTFRGQGLRRMVLEGAEVDMRLTLPEDAQPGLAALANLAITTSDGNAVPLGAVATIELARMDSEIDRENRQTTSRVAVEFDDTTDTKEGQELMKEVMATIDLPEGYTWDFGSWNRRNDDGIDTMLTGVLISLLGVILLMAALFESFSQPLAIIITLPLAFFGGFWALWLGDYDLDMVAFMGLIILIGIVVNNGIVLVDHVNQLRQGGMDRVEALIIGCGERLRPILMTALTTIIGLIPLAMSDLALAGVYVYSVAIVVIGGLTTSTVFTLLALPVWYTTLEDLGALFAQLWPKARAIKARELDPAPPALKN